LFHSKAIAQKLTYLTEISKEYQTDVTLNINA